MRRLPDRSQVGWILTVVLVGVLGSVAIGRTITVFLYKAGDYRVYLGAILIVTGLSAVAYAWWSDSVDGLWYSRMTLITLAILIVGGVGFGFYAGSACDWNSYCSEERIQPPEPSSYDEVNNIQVTQSGDSWKASGVYVNSDKATHENARVVVYLFDANKTVIAKDTVHIGMIEGGGEKSFSVQISVNQKVEYYAFRTLHS